MPLASQVHKPSAVLQFSSSSAPRRPRRPHPNSVLHGYRRARIVIGFRRPPLAERLLTLLDRRTSFHFLRVL